MSSKKSGALAFAMLFVFALACGKGKEAAERVNEGEGHQAPQAAATAPSAEAPAVDGAATIAGTVKLDGPVPKMAAIPMAADCSSQPGGRAAVDEEVVVGPAGALANVLVYIKNPPPGKYSTPSKPAVLEQKGCRFYPHVQAVQVNQPLQIRNDDQTLHNVHAMPVVNSPFNEGQPMQGMVSTKKFDKPETQPFRVKCDVHGWMKSYMAVMPHPFYAVSNMNGTFSIPNLLPGTYTLVTWHEKYGSQEQQITVAPKETKQVAVTYKG